MTCPREEVTYDHRPLPHLLRMATRCTVAMRGSHVCPFCKRRVTMTVDGKDVYLGHAELRARARDVTYVAPTCYPIT